MVRSGILLLVTLMAHRWFAIFACRNGNTADCVVRRTAGGNAGRR
jgi:hypothetical protein